MSSQTFYHVAADLVLLAHTLFVVFVVLGLVLILCGAALRWLWIRNPWFRFAHLLAIAVVVLQSWLGVLCPLTTLETGLRQRAGDAPYAGSFIAHWLEALLYYRAPAWIFMVCYTVFGAVVALSWYYIRPRPFQIPSTER
jgi:multisubunit Na+/H+ antiporter MnhB subunit